MPCVASVEELHRAAAGFAVCDVGLAIEPAALAAARRSLDQPGFLLVGEVHGVRENPLIIRALMRALDLSGLAAPVAGHGSLVVAGNARTPTARTSLGMPLGACLARQRPGVAEIRIRYGGGRCYNIEAREFCGASPGWRRPRLHHSGDALVPDLPAAREAVVPQRPGDGCRGW